MSKFAYRPSRRQVLSSIGARSVAPLLRSLPEASEVSWEMADKAAEQHPWVKEAQSLADHAHQWHQGSGGHASGMAGLVQSHISKILMGEDSKKHLKAASAFLEATRKEQQQMHRRQGEWTDEKQWNKSQSGKAFKVATNLSKKAGFSDDDIDGHF